MEDINSHKATTFRNVFGVKGGVCESVTVKTVLSLGCDEPKKDNCIMIEVPFGKFSDSTTMTLFIEDITVDGKFHYLKLAPVLKYDWIELTAYQILLYIPLTTH